VDQGKTNFSFKLRFWNETHTRLWLLKKYIYKESLRFHTCTFEKKTHLTRSSWKMPKDNCDSRVHFMLVAHANSLGFLWIQGWPLLYKFFRDQLMSSSFSGIDRPLASLYDLKSGNFHLVTYQSVTIHCHPLMRRTIDPKVLCFLVVQNNQSF